jgi:cytochrome c1
MLKSLSIAGAAALLAVSLSFADQSQKIIIPVEKTAANDGKQMYVSYCAPCHGTNGKGTGPVASAMTTGPTDLTVLMKKNHGKFPDAHVVAILQFGTEPSGQAAQNQQSGPLPGNDSGTVNAGAPASGQGGR